MTQVPEALNNLKARQDDETPAQHSVDLLLRGRLSSACSCLDPGPETISFTVTPATSVWAPINLIEYSDVL